MRSIDFIGWIDRRGATRKGRSASVLAATAALALLLTTPCAAETPTAWQLLDFGTPDAGVMTLSYDSLGGRVLGVISPGDATNTGYSLEAMLWELRSNQWKRLYPPHPWPQNPGECSAYDSARHVLVLAPGSDGKTWQFSGAVWTGSVTTSRPSTRTGCKMVYDSIRQRIILFGGVTPPPQTATYLNETWEYDGANWTLKNPVQKPASRIYSGMAFDQSRGVTVLYGGGRDFGTEFQDTWEYNGTTWLLRSPPLPIPGKRRNVELAYDPSRGRVILFGGQLPPSSYFNDTWEWDGTRWTKLTTPQAPSPRWWFTMVFDPTRSAIVGYGGEKDNESLGDTWTLSGTTWANLPTPVYPADRSGAGVAYDTANKRLVVTGGTSDAAAPPMDTWYYSPGSWRLADPPPGSPSLPQSLRLAYDAAGNRIVAFGGSIFGGPHDSDLHEFLGQPPSWSSTPTAELGRVLHGWVAAPALGGVVLFGGRTTRPEDYDNETRLLDGYSWSSLPSVIRPPVRSYGSLAFDSLRVRLYLYGGTSSLSQPMSDFWMYDGASWSQICSPCAPGPRYRPEIQYDPQLDRVLLYGSDPLWTGATWSWDGATWSSIPTPTAPEPYRCDTRLANAPDLEVTFLFGGVTCYRGIRWNDVWAYGADPDQDGVVGRLDNCVATANAQQTDADNDFAGDACDCAASDPSAFALPIEVAQVAFQADKSTLVWQSLKSAAGNGTTYDVLRGRLGEFPVGLGPNESCLATGLSGELSSDPEVPSAGLGYWYLVRGRNVCGTGTYGARSDGAPRQSTACP